MKAARSATRALATVRYLSALLGIALAGSLLLAAVASAAPSLSVAITHAPAQVHRNDEFISYQAVLKNSSPTAATCNPRFWGGVPTPTFTYQWLRDGVSLGSANGAQTATYSPQAADTNHSLQCQVTGTNTVAGVTTSTTAISPPIFYGAAPEIPAPAPKEPENNNSRPAVSGTGVAERTCTAPVGWRGSPTFTFQWLRSGVAIPVTTATATTTNGSTGLTALTTATGTGELSASSINVTSVNTSTGAFRVGQTIVATGIPAGTTIKAVGLGTLELSAAATETATRALSAGAQPITVGDVVSGPGIPAGTTITAISGQTATMSAAATASASGVAVTATATGSKHKPLANSGEVDFGKVLQCQVVGTNVSGAASGISLNSVVGTVTTPPENTSVNTPITTGAEWTKGATSPLNVFVSLPVGLTLAKASSVCSVNSLTCSVTTALAPGASTTIKLEEVWLDESAPDSPTLALFVSGGGLAGTTVGKDTFTFLSATPFGLAVLDPHVFDEAGADYVQAGGHPYSAAAEFEVTRRLSPNGRLIPTENVRNGVAELPPGFVGNPQAASACPMALVLENKCPSSAAVGGVELFVEGVGNELRPDGIAILKSGVYRVPAEKGNAAEFGFATASPKFVVRVGVRTESDYGISVKAPYVPAVPVFVGAKFTFCGFGSKVEGEGIFQKFRGCKKRSEASAHQEPVVTMPTNCSIKEPKLKFAMDSWEHPGAVLPNGSPDYSDPDWATRETPQPPVTGCEKLVEAWTDPGTGPTLDLQPDVLEADTPAGYTAHLHIENKGLTEPNGLSASHLRDIKVTLPEGVTLNPSVGSGVQTCSLGQMGLTSLHPLHFDASLPNCPPQAKLGTAEIVTPLLEKPIKGSIYLAAQHENPFGSDYAIYLVAEDPDEGIVIKLAGKVTPDPTTGQLTTTFEENPQLPFEDLTLRFFGGEAAALANPPYCSVSSTQSELTPWAAEDPANPKPDEIAHFSDPLLLSSGPQGSPCAGTGSERPFDLNLNAGTVNSAAGTHSPFQLRITRPDGAQEMSTIDLTTPPGFSASLKGIPYCSEAQIETARHNTGVAEQQHPSCPAASRLGSILAGAGAGSTPLYSQGDVYLAGPYKGAPLSIVSIVPALAGGSLGHPAFDLGTVVVRSALFVNRATTQVTAKTDPLPLILKGIALRIRDIRITLDRPGFTLNPTSCDPSSVELTAHGNSGATTQRSTRFQVGGCENLGFKPKLTAKVTGGTHRGDHPAFTAELNYPPGAGYANIKDVQVALPHSEFLDQAHINTICTRVQAAANACPQGSIYGYAEAESPLLGGKLTGPVFLKSSDHQLPDLAIALKGPENQPVEVEFAGRIDSVHAQIRNTIEGLPDVPVSKFVLRMKGGHKGLLVNSRNLCQGKPGRMTVNMTAQNNKTADSRPVLGRSCGKAKKGKKHHKRSHRRRMLNRLIAAW